MSASCLIRSLNAVPIPCPELVLVRRDPPVVRAGSTVMPWYSLVTGCFGVSGFDSALTNMLVEARAAIAPRKNKERLIFMKRRMKRGAACSQRLDPRPDWQSCATLRTIRGSDAAAKHQHRLSR